MGLAVTTAGNFAIETYAGLQTYIADVLDRGDLADKIPTFIRLCEYRMERLMPHIKREKVLILTATGESVVLPSDFTEMIAAHLVRDPVQILQVLSPASLREGYHGSGTPIGYSIGNGVMRLGPQPDGEYQISITYLSGLPKLSNADSSNWILENNADAYVYGALVQAEAYLSNDERIGLWRAAFDGAIGEIIAHGLRYRAGGMPMRLASPVVV